MNIRMGLGVLAGLALMTSTAMAQDLTFGYVPGSMIYPYNVATATGFNNAAEAAGVETVVLDPQGEVERQSNAIDDLLAQGVDAIGFLPLDSVVAEEMADRVADRDIPVAAIAVQVGNPDARELQDVYPSLDALVIPDDYASGQLAGELAAGLLPTDRPVKIAIVEGAPGYSVVTTRTAGFRNALDEAGIEYEIVGEQPTDWTPEEGEAVCQNFLTADPDIDLIMSQADDMAVGCARALDAAGSEALLVSASGGSRIGNEAIAAGELDGSVCVRPDELGRLMFEALHEAVTNPDAEKARFVTLDMPVITQENVEDCPVDW